ncbi:MAG: hypothetical protein QOD63_2094 [Actinomycetota bacterium]|nr:hypothetical protein [Actinomycetota bacterium]
MKALATHQDAAIAELVEWWEDLHDCSTGSQLVSLVVPPGWGRTTVLDELAERIDADESRLGTVVRLAGRDAPDGLAMQVAWLTSEFEDRLPQAWRALGLDRSEGVVEAGLGLLGLLGLVAGLPGLVAGLPASLFLKVVVSVRDRAEEGQLATVARLAHGLANYSQSLPLAVLIDDAEILDPRLVARLVFAILDDVHSNALVVAATAPGAAVLARFDPPEPYGPRWERIGYLDVDPTMDEPARRRLVEAMAPAWPPPAVDRLASRAKSYSDVWVVLGLAAAADVAGAGGDDEQRTLIDELARHAIDPGVPPPAARALAWAGGLLHERQLIAAAAALSGDRASDTQTIDERWLSQFGHSLRFAHPAYRERAQRSASVLSHGEGSAIASAIKHTAQALCDEPPSGVTGIDLVSALRPLLHLAQQGVLEVDVEVGALLARLADELEALGDIAGALAVAEATFDVLVHDDASTAVVDDRLLAMILRLGRACGDDSAAERAAALAEEMAAGAIVNLETRIWTAISLLDRAPTRPAGVAMVDTIVEELGVKAQILGEAGVQWRLLLAFHAGSGGYLALAGEVLAPLLGPEFADDRTQDLAFQVLAAVSTAGGADLRLQRQALLVEYGLLEPSSELDVRLAIVEAVASIAHRLGDYREALRFGGEELSIRLSLFGPDHPGTLTTRHTVAYLNGRVGDPRRALALSEALLPDVARVLGLDHPDTLATRHNVASLTGEVGDARGALTLCEALLLDRARVLGPDHPDTLATRHNVASLTGRVGDARGALTLCEALLLDRARVLGPDHPDTLAARANVAAWTGEVGDARGALALFEALLPDMARVLGPDHPHTLATHFAIDSLRRGL